MRCNNKSNAATDEQAKAFQQTVAIAQDLRNKIANFDDFFRPLRNYFYWEPHCFDIPVCAALRSLFDALDGIDALTDQLTNVSGSIAKLDELQPKLLALIPPQIASQASQPRPDHDQLRHHLRASTTRPQPHCRTPPPSVRPMTRRKPTTPSIYRRKRSPTPNSNAA